MQTGRGQSLPPPCYYYNHGLVIECAQDRFFTWTLKVVAGSPSVPAVTIQSWPVIEVLSSLWQVGRTQLVTGICETLVMCQAP